MDKSIGDRNGNNQLLVSAANMMNSKYLHLLRRSLQVVLTVSLLSLFLCYSSGVSLFPYSFSVYFSTCLFSLFTRTLERKYMFLICNGILAFLAKSSVSSSSSSSSTLVESEVVVGDRFPASDISSTTMEEAHVRSLSPPVDDVAFVNADVDEEEEKTAEEEEEEEGEKHHGNESLHTAADNDDEEETEALMAGDEGNEDQEGSWSSSMKKEEEEIEVTETGNEEVTSADELNKKFEEFIRKMKEDLRIEAQQQQLIAV